MNRFTEAIRDGVLAAAVIEVNLKEIDSVFKELNEALAAELPGVFIERTPPEPDGLMRIASMTPRRTYWILSARNTNNSGKAPKEIAQWKQPKEGYPCRIKVDTEEYFCEDKAALEQNLAELLSKGSVGRLLGALA